MRLVILIGCLSALGGAISARMAPAQLPRTYTNLRVLPKDVTGPDLVTQMKAFTTALGTRCEHCHVGEGNDLSKFDFAADTKPEKGTARQMMTLVLAVNGPLLKGVGDPAQAVKVTCYTCHRGTLRPPTSPPAGPGAP
jgi:hypothetical protein